MGVYVSTSMRSLLVKLPLVFLGGFQAPGIEAFADYLLTGSGCWTDLSPEEIIMNHAVVSAAEAVDNLSLRVLGYTMNELNQVILPSFPQTLEVQVTEGGRQVVNEDYQFAIDVVSQSDEEYQLNKNLAAEFLEGSCDGRKRAAGRGLDKLKLVVRAAGAQIVAGWASGHEAVRLTPTISFISSDAVDKADLVREKNPPNTSNSQVQQHDWITTLVDNCPEVADVEKIHHYIVKHASAKLKGSLLTDNQVQIQWSSSAEKPSLLVLVSTSIDATFAGGTCGGVSAPPNDGPRVIVSERGGSLQIPPLSIHKPHTVDVVAFYTTSNDSRVIFRTDPYLLRWVKDSPTSPHHPTPLMPTAMPMDPHIANFLATNSTSKSHKKWDLQMEVDTKARRSPKALQDQALAYQRKTRQNDKRFPANRENPAEGKSHAVSQELELSEQDDKDELEAKSGGPDTLVLDGHPNRIPLHKTEERGHLTRVHPFANEPTHHKPQAASHHDWQESDFTIGWPYFTGVLILVLSPPLVVHLCLKASRKSKGRRTL